MNQVDRKIIKFIKSGVISPARRRPLTSSQKNQTCSKIHITASKIGALRGRQKCHSRPSNVTKVNRDQSIITSNTRSFPRPSSGRGEFESRLSSYQTTWLTHVNNHIIIISVHITLNSPMSSRQIMLSSCQIKSWSTHTWAHVKSHPHVKSCYHHVSSHHDQVTHELMSEVTRPTGPMGKSIFDEINSPGPRAPCGSGYLTTANL